MTVQALFRYILSRPYIVFLLGLAVLIVAFEMQSVPRPFKLLFIAFYVVVGLASILKGLSPGTGSAFGRLVNFINNNGFVTGLLIAGLFGIVMWWTGAFQNAGQ